MNRKVLMLFLDGVGAGRKDPVVNPFFNSNYPAISALLQNTLPHIRKRIIKDGYLFYKNLNATLGIGGLPQSGTGQTALLCGINSAKIIGKHFGPYPYSTLHDIIARRNIFISLRKSGKKVFYANAYPPRYFEYIQQNQFRRTTTTLAWTLSGFKLNDYKKLKSLKALSSDITGEKWNTLGFPRVNEISPQVAGQRLVGFLKNYDFVFYEYFYTDHVGHHQSMEKAVEEIHKIDMLISGIISKLDKERMTLLITSDHGNIEDLSVKTHTTNPVPLIVYGEMAKHINERIKSITHITKEIIKFLI